MRTTRPNHQQAFRGVTFVHLGSESGDDYYLTIPGQVTDEQVNAHVKEEFAGTDDENCVYVEHVERWAGEQQKRPQRRTSR